MENPLYWKEVHKRLNKIVYPFDEITQLKFEMIVQILNEEGYEASISSVEKSIGKFQKGIEDRLCGISLPMLLTNDHEIFEIKKRKNMKYKLSDEVLNRIVQIFQEALLTGVDCSDLMRMIEVEPDPNGSEVMILNPEYVLRIKEQYQKMEEDLKNKMEPGSTLIS